MKRPPLAVTTSTTGDGGSLALVRRCSTICAYWLRRLALLLRVVIWTLSAGGVFATKPQSQVSVSTAGRSPAFAGWLKARIEAVLDDSLVDVVDLLSEVRDDLRMRGISTEVPAWRRALDSGLPERVPQGRIDDARALLIALLALDGVSAATDLP